MQGIVESVYDDDFRLRTLYVNGTGSAVSYDYDPDSLLISAGALILNHDPDNGALTGTSLSAAGHSLSDAYTYNEFGETASYSAKLDNDDPFCVVTYDRDKLGRIHLEIR